jgi:uracil-DNA glycosylase
MENIHSSWHDFFENYNINIEQLYGKNKNVYPPQNDVFKVFRMDINEIKIVLLGQDPYHGKNQANGLSFSVNDGIKIPPSLLNIFKEIQNCFPERNYKFKNGNLDRWFYEEKIFLLNSALTVEEGNANSHSHLWTTFTDDVIKYISENNKECIFVLLGKFAQTKKEFIENRDRIITAPHPSPLAKGFIGSNVFKQIENKIGEVNWNI